MTLSKICNVEKEQKSKSKCIGYFVTKPKGSSSIRHVEIFKNNKIITRTQTLWRLLDSKTFKPITIPLEILEVLNSKTNAG